MTQKLTILFDLDGTLVDTAPDLMDAHNHDMKKFGFEQKRLKDIKHLAGRGAWIMMQRSFRQNISNEKLKKLSVLFSTVIAIVGIVIGPSLISWLFPQYIEAINIIQIIIMIV